MAQAQITGSKIVQCQTAADGLQLLGDRLRPVQIVAKRALGNLDRSRPGGKPANSAASRMGLQAQVLQLGIAIRLQPTPTTLGGRPTEMFYAGSAG
jgi:hypothetical protein